MTPEEKSQKAYEIIEGNPSETDMKIAVGLASEAAADNEEKAIFLMSQLYLYGIGVEEDEKKSWELSQKALDLGFSKAKVIQAIHYIRGKVVEKNPELAEQYLRDLMDQDNDEAYFFMGDFVLNKEFKDIDEYEGLTFLEKAAALGNAKAMVKLGHVYATLCETELSDYWFSKAEEAGALDVAEEKARFNDDNYLERRDEALQFYSSHGKYDKLFNLLERDVAAGDMLAKFQLAYYSIDGLGENAYGRDINRALDLYGQLSAEGQSHADYMLGRLYGSVEEIENPQKSLEYLQRASDAGHTDAQFTLGLAYCIGSYGKVDKTEGMKLIELAAAQEQSDALFILACCYLDDNEIGAKWNNNPGYPKDTARGLDFLKHAAELDNAAALSSMSHCFYLGKYMDKDDNKAFELMNRSCSINPSPERVRILGNFYRDGIGTPRNYEQAAKCYTFAVDNGDIPALSNLATLYHKGLGVQKDEAKANELLAQWHEQIEWQIYGKLPLQVALDASEDGNADAMVQLGDRFHLGDGVEQNIEKALQWWKKSAAKGNERAMYNLGLYYGNNGEQEKGNTYLELAVTNGYVPAFYTLGRYRVENGKEKSEVESGLKYLITAAENDYPAALSSLVTFYHDGIHVDKDYDKARYWLDKFLKTNAPVAHMYMGLSLYHGDMHDHDYAKALEHLTIAVRGGCHEVFDEYVDMRWNGNNAEQNQEEVISIFVDLAQAGNVLAMYYLYFFYKDEKYEGRNTTTALGYLRQAADNEYGDALCEMGLQYLDDGLLSTDYVKANEYFLKASEQEQGFATYNLAKSYELGRGVEQNIKKAMELYGKAIDYGSQQAIIDKGIIYLDGIEGVVLPDFDKAIEFLKPYVEKDATVCYLLSCAYNGKCEEENSYSWQLAEMAAEYMEKAAEGGLVCAMEFIQGWYFIGKGVLVDDEKAKIWLDKVAKCESKSSHIDKMLNLSEEEMCDYALDCRIDYWKDIVEKNVERIKSFQEYTNNDGYLQVEELAIDAAQLGELNALFYIGTLAISLLKEDNDKAMRYIKCAVENGVPFFAEKAGKKWLSELHDNAKALENAYNCFKIGSDVGDVGCFLQLGLLLTMKGTGRKAEKAGRSVLKRICELEGDGFDDERRQAQERLDELEQRPKNIFDGFSNILRKISGKDK